MRPFTEPQSKRLFCRVLAWIVGAVLGSALLLALHIQYAAVCIFALLLLMGTSVLILLYRYFQEQHRIMAQAIAQIQTYLAGNHDVRLECDEEGELYRLFHEVNTLASVLHAHAENESRGRQFMKDTIADISHQLRTPLAALNIYNGILQDDPDQKETVQEFTARSEWELDRINTLIQNLLKLTKLDAGTVVIERTPQNIAELMGEVEQHFRFRAAQEGKRLSLHGSTETQMICDRVWLTEAVGNLVKNALDHTKAGDSIEITWRVFSAMVQIVVRDNGAGIAHEDLPHIFKRFYRSRFSKDTQGIGLGLPLTKKIVEAHSGTIEVESEPKIGTTFILNFLIPTKL